MLPLQPLIFDRGVAVDLGMWLAIAGVAQHILGEEKLRPRSDRGRRDVRVPTL